VLSLATGQLSTYCDALAAQCPQHSMNSTVCQIAMNNVTLGGGGAMSDGDKNTINCRWKYLQDPLYNNTPNACQYAGPSGGGRCGAVLPNICDIATNVCSMQSTASYPDSASCQTGLSLLANQWGYTLGATAHYENSLECRVYHAIAYLSTGMNVHCGHYGLPSPQCNMAVLTNAAHYCSTLEYNCGNGTSANAQFAMGQQCLATAAGYLDDATDDARNDNTGNNLGCREYHSQAARSSTVHCEHAGPSGGGYCGNRRDAWGAILNAAPCHDPTVQMFVGLVGNATTDVVVPTGVSTATPYVPYSTSFDTLKNTQICRIYHLGVASTAGAALFHCAHGTVSGGDNCGTRIGNLCDIINTICGFGSASYQFLDRPTCVTGLTATGANNITWGLTVPQDTTGNTLECRFYHVSVAASYLAAGSAGATTGAAANNQLHCSHTLSFSSACGGGSPPKSGASTLRIAAAVGAVVASVFVL